MSLMQDFKTFAMRGNVIDLAVGVIIGGAFGQIVNSLVNDVVMPPLGLLTSHGLNFKDLFVSLNGKDYPSLEAAKQASAPIIAYGNFINTAVNFLIIAFVVFILIQQITRFLPKPPPPPPPGLPPQEVLLTEIRDLLARRQTNV